MARTFTWVCDRCGTEDRAPETKQPKGWDQVKLASTEKTLDICESCASDLQGEGGRSGHRRGRKPREG